MKAVILAGGYGTRISEESAIKPKPMVEIGNRPILWHIMKIYAAHGINDFIICCGYKSHIIKEYFANYFLQSSDITFDLRANTRHVHTTAVEPWRVTLAETGEQTMTGGRIKKVSQYIGTEPFCLTYGDGVGAVDITQLIAFHRAAGATATMTAVQPPGRFGAFTLGQQQHLVTTFKEKLEGDGAFVNGGFFVCEPGALDYITDDTTVWEREPLEQLASEGKLAAYRHHGFWQPMDTLRDKHLLEELWQSGKPPWKVW